MTALPTSLSTLHSHAIFSPLDDDEEWELLDRPSSSSSTSHSSVGLKTSKMILRDKDLFLAVGKEVRATTLRGEVEIKGGIAGQYKVLSSPLLNFDIQSLVLNPTGRMMAVVGRTQLVVIALPAPGMVGSTSGDLHCKTIAIDQYQYSASSTALITKVLWHPWGAGKSLWILTSDGKLREYDISSPYDPTQTFSFLSDTLSSSKYSAVDPLSCYASSFSFSPYTPTTYDFSPFMVSVLIANGDLYAMGPVMPLRSEIPLRYLQALKAFTAAKIKRSKLDDLYQDENARAIFRAEWVDSLIRQVKTVQGKEGEMVKLHPPHLTETGGPAPGVHRSILLQGPVTYSPAPHEVESDEDEDAACDLQIVDNFLMVAWSSGRVDIALRGDIEPRWISSRDTEAISPTIPILETTFLSYSGYASDNAPSFTSDILHPDTIYISHLYGVHAICIRPWLDEEDTAESEVVNLITSRHPIVGVLSVCNVTLGYGLIAFAASHQLAGIELDFRSATDYPHPEPAPAAEVTDSSSLLLSKPLDFTKIVALPPFNPVQLIRKLPEHNRPLQTVSPAHLRVIGEIITHIRRRVESIRSASQIIENRLDLQVQEYQRQLRLVKSTNQAIEALKSSGSRERADHLLDSHAELVTRLDKVVIGLAAMQKSEIGEAERKWFEELQKLSERFGNINPRIKEVALDLKEAAQSSPPPKTRDPKVSPIEAQISTKSEEIRRLTRKLETLSVRVGTLLDGDEDSEG